METESQTNPLDKIRIQETQSENQKIIDDYVEARKVETNITNYTQLNIIKTLKYFSRHLNKSFQDVTREDIVSYLNSLRKNETYDRNHKWIGTYNLYLVIISTFFKWFFYPKTEPKERPKPDVIQNLKRLKRKEKSTSNNFSFPR
jgi:site-specific recombinase XerD